MEVFCDELGTVVRDNSRSRLRELLRGTLNDCLHIWLRHRASSGNLPLAVALGQAGMHRRHRSECLLIHSYGLSYRRRPRNGPGTSPTDFIVASASCRWIIMGGTPVPRAVIVLRLTVVLPPSLPPNRSQTRRQIGLDIAPGPGIMSAA